MAIELLTPFTKVELEKEKNSNRRQIGILEGTFNPVHNAHLIIADQVRQSLNLEKVLLMPDFSDTQHVVKMLELALLDFEQSNLGIELVAYENPVTSPYNLMKILTERNPDVDFYYILGGDRVGELPTFYMIDELVKIVQLVGVQRPKYRVGTSYPLIWIDVPVLDISSTWIREQVKQGLKPNYLLPNCVLNYILKENLYV
ncbi:nicotinate-nucleotide adenylyltransferase [Floricoccus penangensis]|uniref:Probable nicotinate-nucleotide adenylyltransferase n=1 Tax=Floricoccus penangensis TaxID=1859475 RepID=A0A9Q5JGX0_9LACT|nr:nicotinate-nucleotide adenylyltransferase [Floricoccus penangensis]OFI47182.1 nicotinate-nucleotide adenylyltransferase [Floricoccus penangensis]URZ87362.1 nicotinate-nucleotide adenylyltransferase [Floricoccus penangensis]